MGNKRHTVRRTVRRFTGYKSPEPGTDFLRKVRERTNQRKKEIDERSDLSGKEKEVKKNELEREYHQIRKIVFK